MALSNYLAELWGISLVIIPLALLINQSYLKKIFAEAENEISMFLCGAVNFVIGIAMVLAHNVWVKDWQVIITILGWLALIRGLAFLFFPKHAKNLIKKIESQQWLSIALVIAVFIGLAITYFGFKA